MKGEREYFSVRVLFKKGVESRGTESPREAMGGALGV
jgi:hypothetical protein